MSPGSQQDMSKRFDDSTGKGPRYLWDFVASVLVECPNCAACALVECPQRLKGTPRLSCASCALSRRGWPPPSEAEMRLCSRKRCPKCNDWLGKAPIRFRTRTRTVETVCPCGAVSSQPWPRGSMVVGAAVDPYFKLPLWLRGEVRGRPLWAYNREHLAVLEAYVRADLRRRAPNWNASLASRLPRWLKTSEMRQPVLRAIARLERR